MRARRRKAVTVGALLVCAASACAGPDRGKGYVTASAAAEEALRAGHFAEAAARFDEAAKGATHPRDADHARYLAARALVSAGDTATAAPRLRAIAEASPPGEDSAAAAYALGEAEIARGDDAGWLTLLEIARRFPSSGVGRPALRHVIAHEDEVHGLEATLPFTEKLAPTFAETDLAETVAYETALHLAALGRDVLARDAFVAMAKRWHYPRGIFWDDALFRASAIDEKLGLYADAAGLLSEMLDERESAWLVGSYERPRYEPAMVRLCALTRDRLHDRPRARACFERLYRDFTTSELRDDALWEEARLFREDGDARSACDRLARLADDFPDSRFVPCAVAECPNLVRPKKSGAPRACHPYIAATRLGAEGAPGDGRTQREAPDAGTPD
jgi:TolA-binding protein